MTKDKIEDLRRLLQTKLNLSRRANEMSLKFKLVNTDTGRALAALYVLSEFDMRPPYQRQEKSIKRSTELKNSANKIYVSGLSNKDELLSAWELYNKSIALAPTNSQELSIAYANRSAVLFSLQKYKECDQDINRAMALDYPKKLVPKLLIRKISCYKFFDVQDQESLRVFVKDKLEEVEADSQEEEKLMVMMKDLKGHPINGVIKRKSLDLSNIGRNSRYPYASDALKVVYDEKFGRHVIAARDIRPGEILVAENPFTTHLNIEDGFTHCANCLQMAWDLIPCEHCINVMYCSEECQREAWDRCHDVECKVNDYLIDFDVNQQLLLSLRLAVLAIRQARGVEALKKELEDALKVEDPLERGFSNDKIYHSEEYRSFYTLVTNEEYRPLSDLFERAVNACFVTFYVATLTDFFGKKFSPDLQEMLQSSDFIFFAGLVLRHQQLIPSNVHSYEEEYKLGRVAIGSAPLPFCSLINHSCNPNVCRCTLKDKMVIFSVYPIKKGTQIFDNYGSHYAVMDKNTRQEKLKQFYFDCCCVACTNNWPLHGDLPSYTEHVKDKGARLVIEEALKNLDSYYEYASSGKVHDKPELLPNLIHMTETLAKYISPSNQVCREFGTITEIYKRIFSLLYGNTFEIPDV